MENEVKYHDGKKPNFVEGQKFFDMSFEHDNDETIFGKKPWDENKLKKIKEFKCKNGYGENETIKWTRIFGSEIIPYNENKDEKLNIKQGYLGDCGIISYIHSLKTQINEEILFSIISSSKPNEGYFEVLPQSPR